MRVNKVEAHASVARATGSRGAPEAVIRPGLGIDGKRGDLLLVEGAEPRAGGAGTVQVDVSADELGNRDDLLQMLAGAALR